MIVKLVVRHESSTGYIFESPFIVDTYGGQDLLDFIKTSESSGFEQESPLYNAECKHCKSGKGYSHNLIVDIQPVDLVFKHGALLANPHSKVSRFLCMRN